MVIVSSHIVAPPLRERNRGATRTKHSERQNEQARQARPIKRTSNQVRVVLEDAWSVVAKIELCVESDNRPAEQHTCLRLVVGDEARVLDELREVDLVDGEVSDLGDELEGCQSEVSINVVRLNVPVQRCGAQRLFQRR